MTAEDTGVFLSDAGAEISVRTIAHHTPTATTKIEPLYATDADLLDGATGELRGKAGEPVRGTLRREGNVFTFYPEQPQGEAVEETETTAVASPPVTPVASPPVRRARSKEKTREASPRKPPPRPRTEPNEQTPETVSPAQAEAIAAPTTVAQVPDDRRKVLETAETTSPVASPPAPRRAKPREKPPEVTPLPSPPPPPPRAEPSQQMPENASPSQAEAIEALKTVAQFLQSDRRKVFETPEATSLVASQAPPSQPEAIEAARTVAQFLRGDPSVELELAKQAQAIVSEFIAERERQVSAGDD